MRIRINSLVPAVLALAASIASAQSGFVLFGENDPPPPPGERFVRPLTAPYFNEDSFVTTDLRAWYAIHHFGSDTIGGEADVYALQVRVALTKSLQLVAYKDGYIAFHDTALGSPEGWNDVGAGLKWAFLQDQTAQLYAAVGIGYEFGWGDDDVLQGTDDLRFWASLNKGFDRLHLGATVNYLVAESKNDGTLGNSDMITAHLHADYRVNDWFSPVVELNGFFVTDEGSGTVGFSGVDAVSIGGGENENTLTGALGFEIRPVGNALGLRAAYETELNDSTSLFGYRWTFSAVYEF